MPGTIGSPLLAILRRYSRAMFDRDPLTALQYVLTEFGITAAEGAVWQSICLTLIFGGFCLTFGVGIARLVGLLRGDAPAGEKLGVGLGSGLLVLSAWWAAVASGGRS